MIARNWAATLYKNDEDNVMYCSLGENFVAAMNSTIEVTRGFIGGGGGLLVGEGVFIGGGGGFYRWGRGVLSVGRGVLSVGGGGYNFISVFLCDASQRTLRGCVMNLDIKVLKLFVT